MAAGTRGKPVDMGDSLAARFAAVRAAHGPLVLGADPHRQVLADWGLTDDADGLERFTDIVLGAAAGTVGLIQPQSPFYERHRWRRLPPPSPPRPGPPRAGPPVLP